MPERRNGTSRIGPGRKIDHRGFLQTGGCRWRNELAFGVAPRANPSAAHPPLLQWCHHFIPSHGTAVNQRADSEMVDRFVRSRRTGLLSKAGHPAEKRRGRQESLARGLTRAQTENLQGRLRRGGTHRKRMAILRKTQGAAAGRRTAKTLTTGDLDSVVGRFGSPSATLQEMANAQLPETLVNH